MIMNRNKRSQNPNILVDTSIFVSQEKIEHLRSSIDEVQKYELLTTNQYLLQIEIVFEILEHICKELQQ
jgi:hypothetical protein